MEETKKQFWTGAAVGAAVGGVAGFALAKSASRSSGSLASGAARRGDIEREMIASAALVASADAFANQLEEAGKSHMISGRNIEEVYAENTSGRPNREIEAWVRRQMDRWKANGGLAWAEKIISSGRDTADRLGYLWIMEVQGHGVGLWEDYKDYPKPQLSEMPWVRFRLPSGR